MFFKANSTENNRHFLLNNLIDHLFQIITEPSHMRRKFGQELSKVHYVRKIIIFNSGCLTELFI